VSQSVITMPKIEVQRLSGSMGAEVRGLDLSRELDAEALEAIRAALHEQLALVFRDQELNARDHTRFAEYFGQPFVHPYLRAVDGYPFVHEIRKEPDTSPNFGGVWHTDGTFLETPVELITLSAKVIPTYGGDTIFINQYRSYDALSPTMQRMLEGLQMQHEVTATYSDVVAVTPGHTATPIARMAASHPIVRLHPETGRKCLYLGGHFAKGIVGMTDDESRPLLELLQRHAERPEFQFRHMWRKNDFVVWDNRCTMHYALNDYPGQLRVLQRAFMLETTRPKAQKESV
jgi:taurine dioxygenase